MRRDRTVHVRLTADEHHALVQMALAEGTTVGRLMRVRCGLEGGEAVRELSDLERRVDELERLVARLERLALGEV